MRIISLSPAEITKLIDALQASKSSVLVAIDGPPQELAPVFKIKIDGGIWSPPMGSAS